MLHSCRPHRGGIIEDNRRIRDGLVVLIDRAPGYRCTGAYSSIEEATAHAWTVVPDVALVDIGLPGMSGIEGLSLLHARYPAVALLVLTVYEDDERIFQACAPARAVIS
jgi:DNA-binding NarL/FixJ family response regulator